MPWGLSYLPDILELARNIGAQFQNSRRSYRARQGHVATAKCGSTVNALLPKILVRCTDSLSFGNLRALPCCREIAFRRCTPRPFGLMRGKRPRTIASTLDGVGVAMSQNIERGESSRSS